MPVKIQGNYMQENINSLYICPLQRQDNSVWENINTSSMSITKAS